MATIEIPEDVDARLRGRLDDSDFDTVDEYATYVLIRVLEEIEDAPDDEQLEERLRSLGYL